MSVAKQEGDTQNYRAKQKGYLELTGWRRKGFKEDKFNEKV